MSVAPLRFLLLLFASWAHRHQAEVIAYLIEEHRVLTVEVLTLVGLVRYHVLFVIDLETRRVEIVGIVHNPGGIWTVQAARSLVDAFDGFLEEHRYLLVDRDPRYTKEFRDILKGHGVETLRLPART